MGIMRKKRSVAIIIIITPHCIIILPFIHNNDGSGEHPRWMVMLTFMIRVIMVSLSNIETDMMNDTAATILLSQNQLPFLSPAFPPPPSPPTLLFTFQTNHNLTFLLKTEQQQWQWQQKKEEGEERK